MGTDGIIAKPNISGTLEFSQFLSVFNRASGFSWSDAPRGFAGEPITGWTLDSLWFPIFQLAWKFHHQIHILDKFEGFSVYTSNLETINLGRKIVQIHFQCIESECGPCFNEGFTLTKYQRNILISDWEEKWSRFSEFSLSISVSSSHFPFLGFQYIWVSDVLIRDNWFILKRNCK